MGDIVRVLIVDDSAYVRKAVRQMLSRSPFIEVVGVARDGEEALELVEQLRPDVVTLDLHMPRCDGLDFLKQQMARRPVPVIVLSAASESGELVMQALDAGAVDVVQKPTALANDKVFEVADTLIATVKAVTAARLPAPTNAPHLSSALPLAAPKAGKTDVLVIGVSTGGPQALKRIIPQLPADFPVPIAMVLHMPVGYTELFARSLGEASQIAVAEAQEGDVFRPGLALLAPAGYHLSCSRRPDGAVIARLSLRPLDTAHRPAVDVLFRSAAEVYGDRTLALVLTGMGSDGAQGAAWIKAQGGRVFTEAEETCVVYGMPRSVAEAGLSDRVVPLNRMTEAILGAL
ncbi:chemotaxis response regulator protein-glutamate methylesterase : Chemotaxis response regulator protein-glutamate methylesterase OS=Crinalium epipsammum PCC 9333 GN=cheB PE=3 SV=1: Response_reg: CheB_methylest [Gemmata massiliana]|uniref:Protein-glutamate methylesterase/protein-glutamine glutaminase n=1 Tax=Gemmata massiliana TaxID=1210884 RepID=A0A6P2CY44_9BACT|nr:chemotaxis response regulator protein-glutamate methylesterase [Gemmata massiliana]VTR94048.1 chemotaxis response regulator protein-glutamate methylesterase : Chemotaxis response regulator protein-glutamate methylesterase OS=Crinalium epipsammum PCC 9333 GN=cheB PE=3 SV=1: Response_reg: CheB_methylest [Gemmata massiliana]